MFEIFEKLKNFIAPLKEPFKIKEAREAVTKAYENKNTARRQMFYAECDLKKADFNILMEKAFLKFEEEFVDELEGDE